MVLRAVVADDARMARLGDVHRDVGPLQQRLRVVAVDQGVSANPMLASALSGSPVIRIGSSTTARSR